VTAHCHAATALLIREYQGDHRRYFPDPGHDLRHCLLDTPFHISRLLKNL
jgi:hypothetical protein